MIVSIIRYLQEIGRMLRILSIDVVGGACVMNFFFAQHWNSCISHQAYLILAGVVWLIYTLDHLWDAFHIPHQAHTLRHRFHQKYFHVLICLWVLVALVLAYGILFLLDAKILYYGLLVGCLAVFHFLLSWWDQVRKAMFIQKESRIALVYALGVALSPWVMADYPHQLFDLLLLGGVFLIAWVNLLLISWFEKEIDEKDGHISSARSLGEKRLRRLIGFLVLGHILSMALILLLTFPQKYPSWSLQIMMMLTLALVIWKKGYFIKGEKYRWISDGVFFYPLLLLLLPHG